MLEKTLIQGNDSMKKADSPVTLGTSRALPQGPEHSRTLWRRDPLRYVPKDLMETNHIVLLSVFH